MSFFFAASSPSSLAEVLVIASAAIGGIIVFVGLLLERIAEWKSEKHIVKPRKCLSDWGWRILMLGIAVEIGVAIWSANDAWQTRQMAIKNDPLSQPVSDISASIVLNLDGTNFERINDPFDLRLDNWVTLIDNKTDAPTIYLGRIGTLMAEDVVPFVHADFQDRHVNGHGYVMKYVENPLDMFDSVSAKPTPEFRPVAKFVLEKVRFLRISPSFIPKDAKVTGGAAWLTINGTLRTKFIIYPQGMDTNFQSWNPDFKSLVFLATNSTP